jgi:hypothetical protein
MDPFWARFVSYYAQDKLFSKGKGVKEELKVLQASVSGRG